MYSILSSEAMTLIHCFKMTLGVLNLWQKT